VTTESSQVEIAATEAGVLNGRADVPEGVEESIPGVSVAQRVVLKKDGGWAQA
jgi:hypothetical protein